MGHLFTERYTWSTTNIEAIQKWHNSCRWWHPQCKKTLSQCEDLDPENSPLPSRCIEVRSGCDQEKCSTCPLYFILRETGGQVGKYVALSHRWAPETETVRTLRGNYEYRLANWGQQDNGGAGAGGPFRITRLFAEAGHLALQLGIRYVWIDSACIVQDDADDWARESVRMADYYQRAWLTVAATRTSDFGGLFDEVDTQNLPRVTRLPYRDRGGAPRGHFYLQCSGDAVVARDYRTYVTDSELLRRGWVYQEWILSRRLLTFSGSGLFLTCQGDSPQTTLGDNVQKRWGEDGGGEARREGRTDKSFKKELKADDFSTAAHILGGWEKVVESYSGLQLTKIDGDRLVALAGVASEYGKAFRAREQENQDQDQDQDQGGSSSSPKRPYRYVSGLWFPHVRGLLWEQVRRATIERIGGIPTWSWASAKTRDEDDASKYSGMEVQWSSQWGDTKTTVVCELEDAVAVPVENVDRGADVWRPAFDRAGEEDPEEAAGDAAYDNARRFSVLGLSGRLLPVRIHNYFVDDDDDDGEDARVAAALTSHRQDFGRETWRKVTADAAAVSPHVVVGWASVEHPDYQAGRGPPPPPPPPEGDDGGERRIYALFVASIENIDQGLAVGNVVTGHLTTYKALYLRRRAGVPGYEDAYERVGVGRLFGNEVEALFRSTREERIWLV